MATQPATSHVEKKPSGPKPLPAHEKDHGHAHDDHGHGHGHADMPFLQHHFDSPQQQFDAGKLGIWAFLVTEVLFFAGLFCAYTIYRAQHTEVYVWAHYFLDTKLGALNTVVLLVSSLTAAWAVRCAQLGNKKALITNIVVTIACAATFMCVKYFEYTHKFHDGLVWGGRGEKPIFGLKFDPHEEVWELPRFKHKHPEAAELAEKLRHAQGGGRHEANEAPAEGKTPMPTPAGIEDHPAHAAKPALAETPPNNATAAATASEIADMPEEASEPLRAAGLITEKGELLRYPPRGHVFFSIYFFMTGLHGFHVLAGIVVWVWLLRRAARGDFGPKYFGPIDYAALYWHLVDLIWIYLFPLLYLIA